MANGQTSSSSPAFDGQTPVPGYTLFQGKDGQSYYFKGEGLSDTAIAAKVSAARSQSPGVAEGAPDANAQAAAAIRKPIDQLHEKAFSIFTPTGDVPKEQLEATRQANNMMLTGAAALTGAPAVAGAFAPTAVAGTAGTGILDASGAEIMKEITTLGPSTARTFYSGMQAAAAAHPLAAKLMAYSLTSLGLGKIAHSLGWVGNQAP